MPNIKSAKKRVELTKVANARNKAEKSMLKTNLKKFDAALTEGNREAADAAYKIAVKSVDQAVNKGLLHKNTQVRGPGREQGSSAQEYRCPQEEQHDPQAQQAGLKTAFENIPFRFHSGRGFFVFAENCKTALDARRVPRQNAGNLLMDFSDQPSRLSAAVLQVWMRSQFWSRRALARAETRL